jgi:hypothetical protein
MEFSERTGFGAAFKARVRAMGIRDRPTSFRSPLQNGHVEALDQVCATREPGL